MRPITIGLIAAVFALAEKNRLVFLGFENDGFELRGLVVAVAKRLIFGKTASTPGVVFPRDQIHFRGKFKGDMGFPH